MAKIATAETKLPELKLPKVNLDALFGLQKANLAVVHEAQSILVDAAQAIAKVQYGWVEDVLARVQAALNNREPKKPEAVLADVQAAAEQAVQVAKQGVDLGVAAQQRVVELFTKRAQANVDELKSLAA